jgi:hypothetical protein
MPLAAPVTTTTFPLMSMASPVLTSFGMRVRVAHARSRCGHSARNENRNAGPDGIIATRALTR